MILELPLFLQARIACDTQMAHNRADGCVATGTQWRQLRHWRYPAPVPLMTIPLNSTTLRHQVLTKEDAAAILRVSVRTIDNLLMTDDTFPRPRFVMSMPRWSASQIIGWLEAPNPHLCATPAVPRQRTGRKDLPKHHVD